MRKIYWLAAIHLVAVFSASAQTKVGFRTLYLSQSRGESDSILRVDFKQPSITGDTATSNAWFFSEDQKSIAELGCEYAGDTLCIKLNSLQIKHRGGRIMSITVAANRIPRNRYDDEHISDAEMRRALRILYEGLNRRFGLPTTAKLYNDSAHLRDSILFMNLGELKECARWDIGGTKNLPQSQVQLCISQSMSYRLEPKIIITDLQAQRDEETDRQRLEDERRRRDANPTINTKF